MGTWVVLVLVLCSTLGEENVKRSVYDYSFTESANPSQDSLSNFSEFAEDSSSGHEFKLEGQHGQQYQFQTDVSFPNKEVHENVKTIIVTKKIPVPYPVHVEKKVPYTVKVPVRRPYTVYVPKPYLVEVPKPVPYTLKVPIPQPYTVEKHIPVPYKVPVDKPFPIHIAKPYPVYFEKKVPVHIEKQIPYQVKVPVDRPYPVHVAVEKPVPYPVEKPVPYPVKVAVERPLPVPIEKPVPVPIEKPVPYPVEKPVPYPVPVKESTSNDHTNIKAEDYYKYGLPSGISYGNSQAGSSYHVLPTSQITYEFTSIPQNPKLQVGQSSYDSSVTSSYNVPSKQKVISFLPGHGSSQLYAEAFRAAQNDYAHGVYPIRTTVSVEAEAPKTSSLGTIHVTDNSYAPQWRGVNYTDWTPKFQEHHHKAYSLTQSQNVFSTPTITYTYQDPMQNENSQISEAFAQHLVSADGTKIKVGHGDVRVHSQKQSNPPQSYSNHPQASALVQFDSNAQIHGSQKPHQSEQIVSHPQITQATYEISNGGQSFGGDSQPVHHTLTAPKLEAHNSAFSYQNFQDQKPQNQEQWSHNQQHQQGQSPQDHAQPPQQFQEQYQPFQNPPQNNHQPQYQLNEQPNFNSQADQHSGPQPQFNQQQEVQHFPQQQQLPPSYPQQSQSAPHDPQHSTATGYNNNNSPQWNEPNNQQYQGVYQPSQQNLEPHYRGNENYPQHSPKPENQLPQLEEDLSPPRETPSEADHRQELEAVASSPKHNYQPPAYNQDTQRIQPSQKRGLPDRHGSHSRPSSDKKATASQENPTPLTKSSSRQKSEERTEAPPSDVQQSNSQVVHHVKHSRNSNSAVSYTDITRNYGKKMKRRSHKKRPAENKES